jgi:UDPglucose 6-dehydrogenase
VATQDTGEAYRDAGFVIVATPTHYNPDSNKFDTSAVDSVVEVIIKASQDWLVIVRIFLVNLLEDEVRQMCDVSNIRVASVFLIIFCLYVSAIFAEARLLNEF